jgi:hypothetical protein
VVISQAAIVTLFGAIVAAFGLALLYFRREQAENRIKLFGQEFQISTPALVVFLVGCAIFILPVVVHMPNETLFSLPWPWSSGGGSPVGLTPQYAISTDRDHPTKIRSNEIRGAGVDRKTVRYYLRFVGGPGEVKLTFDFAPQGIYQSCRITLYDVDFAELDHLTANSNERVVRHIQVSQPQALIIEVLLDSSGDSAASFLLRVEGAVRFQ